jgi:hypothetical protein
MQTQPHHSPAFVYIDCTVEIDRDAAACTDGNPDVRLCALAHARHSARIAHVAAPLLAAGYGVQTWGDA